MKCDFFFFHRTTDSRAHAVHDQWKTAADHRSSQITILDKCPRSDNENDNQISGALFRIDRLYTIIDWKNISKNYIKKASLINRENLRRGSSRDISRFVFVHVPNTGAVLASFRFIKSCPISDFGKHSEYSPVDVYW